MYIVCVRVNKKMEEQKNTAHSYYSSKDIIKFVRADFNLSVDKNILHYCKIKYFCVIKYDV
jgi:hypothetical protein